MGCDIHSYIDYDKKSSKHDKTYTDGLGRIRIGRDYYLFGLIAGVRGNLHPVVPVRGLPKTQSIDVKHDSCLYVNNDAKDSNECDGNTCTAAQAIEWVEQGSSEYVDNGRYVTHPDWHNYTWLTLDEVKEVLKQYKKSIDKDQFGNSNVAILYAIIGAMSGLEKVEGYKSRLVCWFDN